MKVRAIHAYALSLLVVGDLLISSVGFLLGEMIPASLLLYFIVLSSFTVIALKRGSIFFPTPKSYSYLLVLFFISLPVSLLFNNISDTTVEKLVSITYLIISPVFLVYFSSILRGIELNVFVKSLRVISIVTILVALIFLVSGLSFVSVAGKISISGTSNTIWFGRGVSLAMMVILITATRKYLNIVSTFLLCLIGIYLLELSGSRGALVSLIVAGAYYVYKPRNVYLITFVIVILSFIVVFIPKELVQDLFLQGGDYSNYGRVALYIESFSYIYNNPLTGMGIGNYGLVMAGEDKLHYPHNIFIELFAESGFVSFFIFSIIIYKILIDNKVDFIIKTLFVFSLTNALFSGDITGNRILFVVISICLFVRFSSPDKDTPESV